MIIVLAHTACHVHNLFSVVDCVEHIFGNVVDVANDVTVAATVNVCFKEAPVIHQGF